MKINGLKHLNNNFYDYIMIRNLDMEYTKIDVKSDLKIDTLKNKNTFYNNIKNLSEKDKIKEIIRYYLRNNKIYSITDKCELSHYDGYFTVIEGNRNLYLQLKENSLDKEILNEIKEKYIMDRYQYVTKNDFNKIDISYSYRESSCYLDKYRNEIENVLNITLKDNDGRLVKFEEEFILNYMNYLFSKSDKKINYYPVGISIYMNKHFDTLKFGEYPGLYYYNDDFIIKVNNNLMKKIDHLVYNHNKYLNDVKKLQLSLSD